MVHSEVARCDAVCGLVEMSYDANGEGPEGTSDDEGSSVGVKLFIACFLIVNAQIVGTGWDKTSASSWDFVHA